MINNKDYNLKEIKRALESNPFDFKVNSAEYFGKGQYCFVFLINDKYIFKFPRYTDVNDALRKEAMVLQLLQGKTSISIPNVKFTGVIQGIYYVGYEIIKGDFLTNELFKSLTEEHQNIIINQLANFFNELHSIDIEKLPEDLIELKEFKHTTREYFLENYNSKLASLFDCTEDNFIRTSFAKYLNNDDNFNYQPVITHGDLHFENLIYDKNIKKIIGIIDFGDVCLADNIYDFRYIDLHLGRQITNQLIKNYTHKISGKWQDKLEIFNLCNYIFDALWSIEHNNQKGSDFAINKLKETISKYKEYK